MSHNYNTRSKGSVSNSLKSGSRGPPPMSDPQPEEGDEPVTVYLDDVLRNIQRKQEMNSTMNFINMLTNMANSELQSKQRGEEVRKKRKKKQDKEYLKLKELEDPPSLTDELQANELEAGEVKQNIHIINEGPGTDCDDEEGISLESLIQKITEDSDSDDEYDEHDEEYCDLCEDETMGMEDSEWSFFHDLEKTEKKKFLEGFKGIKALENNKPLRFKIVESELPLDIKSISMQKVMSLNQMDSSSGEYFKSEQWLNTLMNVPFGKYHPFPVNLDSDKEEISGFLGNLSTQMTDAIYGHSEAKCQILQMVGQSIRNPESAGNVLAIQGPMGNGKTTLVKEGIAKALGRPFAFIALGGATDASFFDGHNFTYEGSRWGKIVDVLIQCKCMNPIFYFDELDKISDTNKGQEIIHLLTHLTDSSQNSTFNDNYFTGIDFDLSKALFIFSFNDESMVDPILKDRMTVINTDGFNTKEKRKIAREYLLPNIYTEYNIQPEHIVFDDDIINNIVENYTASEKGVRNLKRCMYDIVSKINVWTMLSEKDRDDLPFKLKSVEYPYKVTADTCTTLLKNNKSNGGPTHMYL
jgi:hypothetical protein